MVMKINLNLNKHIYNQTNQTLSILFSVFPFLITDFYEIKGFSPTFGELQFFNKIFISFLWNKKKKKATKIVLFKRSIFCCSQERSLYDTNSAKIYSSLLNCLWHSFLMKGPKFSAVLCKELYIDSSLVAIYCSLLFKIVTYNQGSDFPTLCYLDILLNPTGPKFRSMLSV